jgi:dihydroflavonol-4-reductase
MKVAVTGAAGHIGSNLCRVLIERGYQVKALIHHDTAGLKGLPLEFVKGDATKEPDLENLLKGCGVVFHLAAYISIRKSDPFCHELNVGGCEKILKAAKNTGIRRIIHFSSIHAFSGNKPSPELNECCSLSLESGVSYDRSKALSQKLMLEASSEKLEIIALNPTAVIGPNDFKPSFLGNAIIRFYKGKNPGLIPGGYNWVDVRDICSAAVSAIDHGKPGECYLLGGRWQSLETLAKEIAKNGGHRPPRLKMPMWIANAMAPLLNLHSYINKNEPLYTSVSLATLKNSHRNISCEKARSAFNYTSRPFSDTIRDTITWFRENNYI